MVSTRSTILRCALVSVGAMLAYIVLPLQGDHPSLGIVAGIVLVAAAVPIMWRVLQRVNESDRPVVEAVAFLAAFGTLAILIPASAYVATVAISPGSFDGLETKVDGVYFTVTVLSTVGFGDIHAVSQGARMLTTAHILLSIVLLGSTVKLLSRVVGLRVTERGDDDPS